MFEKISSEFIILQICHSTTLAGLGMSVSKSSNHSSYPLYTSTYISCITPYIVQSYLVPGSVTEILRKIFNHYSSRWNPLALIISLITFLEFTWTISQWFYRGKHWFYTSFIHLLLIEFEKMLCPVEGIWLLAE